jgi:hypothetical protein
MSTLVETAFVTQIEQDGAVGGVGVEGQPDLLGLGANRAKTRLGTTPVASVPLKLARPDTVGKKNR